jgi:DNA topoisomerase-6 subunit B
MAVRELVENSLDSAEMAGILPDIYVKIVPETIGTDIPDPRPYRLSVIDNGTGVAPQHVPSAFGKVFYGSK